MPFNKIKKEKQYIVIIVSLVVVQLFSLLLWFLEGDGDLQLYSDKLVLVSIFAFCCGSIMAITAKSRRHYYKHIQEKYKSGNHDDTTFDKDQEQRDRHANVGLLVAISGVVSFLIGGALLYIQ